VRGEQFMSRYHQLGDLAPRDVVARGIDREMKTSGDASVFLDLRHLDRNQVEKRFPNLVKTCAKFGIDMAGEPVPVVPAAHYMCGGVAVDIDGQTSLPGLFAIGEVACTGIHGANRLASNSLLEAVFFATRAAAVIATQGRVLEDGAPVLAAGFGMDEARSPGRQAMVLEHDWDLVRRVMWDYVGIVRDRQRLDIALERLRAIRQTVEVVYLTSVSTAPLVELRNIALLGELIVMCGRARHESRGLHYTLDHPHQLAQAEDTVIIRHGTLEGEVSWEAPEDACG
jgi:L-aspartate oxidase